MNNNMKKHNIIYFLLATILIVVFLFNYSIPKNQNTNTNTNVINVEKKANKQKININTADKAELMSIDGIGDKKTDLIIKNRPYESIWDLKKARISEQFIKKIQDNITT